MTTPTTAKTPLQMADFLISYIGSAGTPSPVLVGRWLYDWQAEAHAAVTELNIEALSQLAKADAQLLALREALATADDPDVPDPIRWRVKDVLTDTAAAAQEARERIEARWREALGNLVNVIAEIEGTVTPAYFKRLAQAMRDARALLSKRGET